MPPAIIKLLMASILLTGATMTHASPPPPNAVIVELQISGQSADSIERAVVTPLEGALQTLARLKGVKSTITNRGAYLEVAFNGGASDLDLAAVADQVNRLDPGGAAAAKTSSLRLGPPRADF